MSYADIEIRIIQWAEARKIIPNSNPESQLLKAVSEIGELADATIKKDREAIVDSVGDVMVCLINYCALQDINLVEYDNALPQEWRTAATTIQESLDFVRDVRDNIDAAMNEVQRSLQ